VKEVQSRGVLAAMTGDGVILVRNNPLDVVAINARLLSRKK